MISLITTLLILIAGLAVCVAGINLIHEQPILGGFLMGGSLGYYLFLFLFIPPAGLGAWFPLIGFAVGGAIGAIVARPLYMVILVLTSSMLGGLVGLIISYVLQLGGSPQRWKQLSIAINLNDPLQVWLMIIFALVLGFLALPFEEFMTMLSTGFVGGAMFVSSLVALFAPTVGLLNNPVFVFFFWFAVGMAGLAWQNHTQQI
jgi:hypothetical protein